MSINVKILANFTRFSGLQNEQSIYFYMYTNKVFNVNIQI